MSESIIPVTQWTLVSAAASRDGQDHLPALDTLLRQYLPVLRSYLIGVHRLRPDQVDDLLQDFIKDKLLLGDLLQRADPQRGSFRNFLLASVKRYVISRHRYENAARRSPGEEGFVRLEEAIHVADGRVIPAPVLFDMAWLHEVFREARERARQELYETGRGVFYEVFEARVTHPSFNGDQPVPYEDLVKRLKLRSPTHASNGLVTAKRVFERQFRAVIRQYVSSDAEVDTEIAAIHTLLSTTRAQMASLE
jgi:DNA-directed RNA polymerase specialized sigma24 family protein